MFTLSACIGGATRQRTVVHSTHAPSVVTSTISLAPALWGLRPIQVSIRGMYAVHITHHLGISVVVAAVSSLLFTILVLCCSFITTSLLPDDERETTTYLYGVYSPVDVIQGLVRATVNTFVDDKLLDDTILSKGPPSSHIRTPGKPPGLLKRLVRRFLLGLPVVGAGSIAHMLLSIPLPFHWVRLRTINRGRDSRDIMALLIVTVVLIGAAR